MRKWAALLAAALLLSLLTACLTQSGQEEEGARLWFITPSAQQKIQVTPALASCPYEGQETVSGCWRRFSPARRRTASWRRPSPQGPAWWAGGWRMGW